MSFWSNLLKNWKRQTNEVVRDVVNTTVKETVNQTVKEVAKITQRVPIYLEKQTGIVYLKLTDNANLLPVDRRASIFKILQKAQGQANYIVVDNNNIWDVFTSVTKVVEEADFELYGIKL